MSIDLLFYSGHVVTLILLHGYHPRMTDDSQFQEIKKVLKETNGSGTWARDKI
jgi:hypothetical protein